MKTIICEKCGTEAVKTTNAVQRFCKPCSKAAQAERGKRHYVKNNPEAYKPKEVKVCSVCEAAFSSSFEGVPYCNKHYLRMKINGTPEKVGRKKNEYTVSNGVVTMKTHKGEPFQFDEIDLPIVKKHSWCFNATGYLVANTKGKILRLHRFILGVDSKGLVVDHINGEPTDNRRCNLRITTQKNNSRNCRLSKNNTSGYPGVELLKKGVYRSRITVNRKGIHLGLYDTFEEAVQARKEAEVKYYGDFAPSKGALK